MTTMICTHCKREFDVWEGYCGSIAHPFCTDRECVQAYLAPVTTTLHLFPEMFTGYDPPDKK